MEQSNTLDFKNICTIALVVIKFFSKVKNENVHFEIWTKETINKTWWIYLLICKKVKYQRLMNWNKLYDSVAWNLDLTQKQVLDEVIDIKYLSQIVVKDTYHRY